MCDLGFQCDIVHSIDAGLKAAASREYKVILVGCVMGDEACWVFMLAVKLLPRKGSSPDVIGMLSLSISEMEERCTNMGVVGVLIKPVSKAALSKCVKVAIHRRCSEPQQQDISTCEIFGISSDESTTPISCGNGQGQSLISYEFQLKLQRCQPSFHARKWG